MTNKMHQIRFRPELHPNLAGEAHDTLLDSSLMGEDDTPPPSPRCLLVSTWGPCYTLPL